MTNTIQQSTDIQFLASLTLLLLPVHDFTYAGIETDTTDICHIRDGERSGIQIRGIQDISTYYILKTGMTF